MDETFHNLFDINCPFESFVSTFRLKRQKVVTKRSQ